MAYRMGADQARVARISAQKEDRALREIRQSIAAQLRKAINHVTELIGAAQKGELLIKKMDAEYQSVRAPHEERPASLKEIQTNINASLKKVHFPRPFQFGGVRRWKAEEVDDWIECQRKAPDGRRAR